MEYKLLAVDLDGTLLNAKMDIDKETIEALHDFKSRGGKIIICSGRTPLATRWIAETIRISDPIIAYNGAVIQGPDGKIIQQSTFKKESLLAFIDACQSYGVYGHLYEGDCLLVPEKNKWNEKWIENNILPLQGTGAEMVGCERFRAQCEIRLFHSFDEYVKENEPAIQKLAAFRKEQGDYEGFMDRLFNMENHFEVSSSFGFTSLEITPPKTTKASALEYLAKRLGLDMSEVAAIGDNLNDRQMLLSAGLGIAMGNAPEEVKEAADAVTEPNDRMGVAHAIKKYIM
ncbi:HAD family hydrolase [Bacillus sp. D386]|uniref:HAD family hydrolase n=1 Tax=Bacillus sp. D386 TaxID=2587155 RepID=UPI0015D571D4|nr:HAD family hydrolase [Bacillus sp. D386]